MITPELEQRVRAVPLWYHTLELAPGLVTEGWFDLRPIVDLLPWPDVRGKRCLDVGTYDGFLAFELERRGADEVIATDISDHSQWDWTYDMRSRGPETLAKIAGPEKGLGFRLAKEALGSSVEKVEISVYDLSPDRVGVFDVVVCGSLLLHLRDPLRALEAIRSVTAERFMSSEQINLPMSIAHPRRPLGVINAIGELIQWTVPNAAGHAQMVRSAGFEIERTSRIYSEAYGRAHPPRRGGRAKVREALQRVFSTGPGVPHRSVLARPI